MTLSCEVWVLSPDGARKSLAHLGLWPRDAAAVQAVQHAYGEGAVAVVLRPLGDPRPT